MKTLCDYSRKDIDKDLSKILTLVRTPKYICIKCARAAKERDALCKPIKIKEKNQRSKA